MKHSGCSNTRRRGRAAYLWGMFKKVVVADTCAIYANDIFANYYSGPTLMLGAVYFAFQIYGDFSGYSDIAIGTAKLFGIQLMTNFKTPYFSRDIAEFWRRWHISLSTWFPRYLYIPLGGSRVGKWKAVRNVFIIFLVADFGTAPTGPSSFGWHPCRPLSAAPSAPNRRYTSETIARKVAADRSRTPGHGVDLHHGLCRVGVFSGVWRGCRVREQNRHSRDWLPLKSPTRPCLPRCDDLGRLAHADCHGGMPQMPDHSVGLAALAVGSF